jgi:hypothetical protein
MERKEGGALGNFLRSLGQAGYTSPAPTKISWEHSGQETESRCRHAALESEEDQVGAAADAEFA